MKSFFLILLKYQLIFFLFFSSIALFLFFVGTQHNTQQEFCIYKAMEFKNLNNIYFKESSEKIYIRKFFFHFEPYSEKSHANFNKFYKVIDNQNINDANWFSQGMLCKLTNYAKQFFLGHILLALIISLILGVILVLLKFLVNIFTKSLISAIKDKTL